jgi:hypothetical protein
MKKSILSFLIFLILACSTLAVVVNKGPRIFFSNSLKQTISATIDANIIPTFTSCSCAEFTLKSCNVTHNSAAGTLNINLEIPTQGYGFCTLNVNNGANTEVSKLGFLGFFLI